MANNPSQDEEEVPAIQTGPKGVINDWRRFKLDSADAIVPPSKKELLRQMSTPKSDDLKERAHRKMSVQEYQLIQEEDERCMRRYRKRSMQDMHERLSFGPTFQGVYELASGEAFLEVIENEHRHALIVVHVYKDGVKGCEALHSSLDCLAGEYSSVKFCKIDAESTGAGERFPDDVLPAMLVYKAGELLGNFVSVTQHLNEEFFATDVEAFLNEYGLLPEKELTTCPDDEGGEGVAEVE